MRDCREWVSSARGPYPERVGYCCSPVGSKNDDKSDDKSSKKDDKAWKQYSTELTSSPGHRVWLDKNGGIAARNSDIKSEWLDVDEGFGWRYNRMATAKSADKLNDYLKRTGYSLQPGDDKAVVGYQKVTLERTRNGGMPWMWSPGNAQSDGEIPGGKEYLPIYGTVNKAKKGGGDESGGGGEGGPIRHSAPTGDNVRIDRGSNFDATTYSRPAPTLTEWVDRSGSSTSTTSTGGTTTSNTTPTLYEEWKASQGSRMAAGSAFRTALLSRVMDGQSAV